MELELKGVEELRGAVDRLTMCAKTLMMAADKIDDALSAHIAAMDNHVSRLETLERRESERQEYANLSQQHGG